MSPHNFSSARAPQRGVSMVEALVALLVLSIGMLGIAGLYVTSLQANRTALLRTQAVSLVNDMLDRIRSNPMARDNYDMATYSNAPKNQSCVAAVNNCSYQMLAQDDLYRWTESVKVVLPGTTTPKVTVTKAASKGRPDSYLVLVTWNEPGETQPFSYQGNLTLIPVEP